MKKNIKRSMILVIILIIIILLVIDIAHWGVCFHHRGGFSGSDETYGDLFEQQGPFLTIGKRSARSKHIPYLLHLYLLRKPPYEMNIFINDEGQSMKQMTIETIDVIYDSGIRTTFELNWQKNFVKTNLLRRIDDANVTIPIMRLEETIPAIVERSQSCTIKLKGYFEDTSGNIIEFNTNDYFEYESTYWDVYWFGDNF